MSIFSFAAVPKAKRLTLLECNVVSGDYQAINVYQEGTKLILAGLSSHGSWEEYNLPAKQWKDQKITLPCPYVKGQNCGHVYLDRGDWVYRIGNLGYYNMGMCQ
jgi:hypothetical protein